MAKRSGKPSFAEWTKKVDELVRREFDSSLSEIDADVPKARLREAYDNEDTPEQFIDDVIAPVFDSNGDDDFDDDFEDQPDDELPEDEDEDDDDFDDDFDDDGGDGEDDE